MESTANMNCLRAWSQTQSTVFHSNGPNRAYQVNNTQLEFKHVALKETGFRHQETAVVVHALKFMGQYKVDSTVIKLVRRWLPEEKKKAVLRDAEGVTEWVYKAVRKICEEQSDG